MIIYIDSMDSREEENSRLLYDSIEIDILVILHRVINMENSILQFTNITSINKLLHLYSFNLM